jgi:hypothetical protein
MFDAGVAYHKDSIAITNAMQCFLFSTTKKERKKEKENVWKKLIDSDFGVLWFVNLTTQAENTIFPHHFFFFIFSFSKQQRKKTMVVVLVFEI